MNEYIILMYQASDNAGSPSTLAAPEDWARYLGHLRSTGQFDGGSAIGDGERVRKGLAGQPVDAALTGYLRVRAVSLQDAKALLVGNPVYEAGGVVEIRALLRS